MMASICDHSGQYFNTTSNGKFVCLGCNEVLTIDQFRAAVQKNLADAKDRLNEVNLT